jgi:uncharacterized protein (TIRG00374 family)
MARPAPEGRGDAWLGRKRWTSLLVGTTFSVALMWLAFSRVEWDQVRAAVSSADLWPWIPFGMASYLLGHLVRGWRCRVLVSEDTSLSLTTASNVVVLGYATNNVFPARLGELVRAGMLAERSGIPLSQALSVTAFERVLDAATILALLVCAAATIGFSPLIIEILPAAALIVALGLGGLLVLVMAPDTIVTTTSRLALRRAPGQHARAARLAQFIAHGTAALRRPPKALLIVTLSLVVWLLEATMFLCVLPALEIAPNFSWALLAMTVTNLGILVPSTPGFVGPFHFFCMTALTSVGVPEASALGAAVLVHITFFVPVTVWGGVAAIHYGVRFGAVWSTVAAARAKSGSLSVIVPGAEVIAVLEPEPDPAPPSRFTVALTEALTEEATRHLPAAPRDEATLHAARFVHGQMGALHPRLKALYNLGMLAFRIYVRAATLRGFCDLSRPRRVRVVHAWCYGPVSLTRQLFRAPRSTALLAVYEFDGVLQTAASDAIATPREGVHPN